MGDSTDNAKFLDQGLVQVVKIDPKSRQAVLTFNTPLYMAQAAFPALLSAGSIDSFEITQPPTAFVPNIQPSQIISNSEQAATRFNKKMSKIAMDALVVYMEASQFLKRPSDVLPILPIGVYVSIFYSFEIDPFIIALSEKWEAEPGSYEDEFKWAVTRVMAFVLEKLG